MIDPKLLLEDEFNAENALIESIVKHNESIAQSEVLIWINDNGESRSICTRGNLSTILGKAKSRKTFFITMLIASMFIGILFNKIRGRRTTEKIVLFDTEQGRYRAQRVLLRIIKLAGLFSNFEVLSLRKYNSHERMQIIQKYFEINKVAFAVIDGVRDLIADFNNLEQSNELVTELMRISEVYNCHLCLVLHMNKGDNNARGHLGTELMNKAETIISVNKEKGSNFSDVSPEYMRDEEFESFQFTIKDGLPVVVGFENTIIDGKLVNEYGLEINSDINPNSRIEPNANFEQETPF
jgi:hypothetical protein